MSEWIHEGLPPLGAEAWVWQGGASVRRVRRDQRFGQLMYLDCTYPEQNAYCDPQRVLAWRLTGGEISPPPTQQMIDANMAWSAIANSQNGQRLDVALFGFPLA